MFLLVSSKSAGIHNSPFPNIWLMLYANGTVWTNYRMNLSGPCEMDLTAFPMDTVKCRLTFESFNYNTDEVQMIWHPMTPVSLFHQIKLKWMEKQGMVTLGPEGRVTGVQLADYELIAIQTLREQTVSDWLQMAYCCTFSNNGHYMHWFQCMWYPSPPNSCFLPT